MPKTITGLWSDAANIPQGNATLFLTLSQDAVAVGISQIAPSTIRIPLTTAGTIPPNTTIYGNDELIPSGTVYAVTVIGPGGTRIYGPENFSIVGTAPINLNNLLPVNSSGSAVFVNPILPNPLGDQTITQPVGTNLFVNRFENIRFADQFPSLQAAIDDLPSTGGTIYLPAGTYSVNSALTLKSNVNIVGMGSAQIDSVNGPSTITSTLGSGDLFYFNHINDCHLSNFSIKYTGTGANSCIRLTAAQRNTFADLYLSGAFNNQVILDSSSSAPSSCIWNEFRNIHTTGTAASGNGLVLDSKDATNKVINGNFFYNFRATAGANGKAVWLTNSGVHNQIINENVFWASEVAGATGAGTGLLVDQASTRGVVFIDCDIEGNFNGLNKALSNTVTFIGGNISSNTGTNVTDAQPGFTQFIGTNVGGTIQTFAVTPAGGIYADGIGLNGSAPVQNTLGGATGWALTASGNTVAFVNSTSLELNSNKSLLMDSGSKIGSYNGIATVSNGIPVEYATVDLTAQTAAIGTTTLYAVPASGAGQYMLSWNTKVTTAAGVSSTLGPLTVTYTDPDGVVQTLTAAAVGLGGAIATSNTANNTTAVLIGMPLLLNCKASTNVQYAFGYNSNAAAAMNYNLHLKLEAL